MCQAQTLLILREDGGGGQAGDGGSQTISSQIRKQEDTDKQGKATDGKLAEPPAATQFPAPQKSEATLE